MRALVVLVVVFFCSFSFADEFVSDDISAELCRTLNREWRDVFQTHFRMDRRFETPFNCPSDTAAVARALHDVYRSGTETLENFYPFVRGLVDEIQLLRNGERICAERGGPLALAYIQSDRKTAGLCPSYFSTNAVERAAALVHEAAHLHSRSDNHEVCREGLVRDNPVCDPLFRRVLEVPRGDSRNRVSGYSTQALFYRYIAKAERITNSLSARDIKLYARAVLVVLVNNRFNRVSERDRDWLLQE